MTHGSIVSELAERQVGVPAALISVPPSQMAPFVVLVWKDKVQEDKSTSGLGAHTLVPG